MARKKQIILTQDEAIAMAKKELAPYWIYSAPVVTVLPPPANQLFPLDSKFNEKTWVFLNLDPTDIQSNRLLKLALEWNGRYSAFNFSLLLIIHPTFEFYKTAKTSEEIMNRLNLRVPTVLDFELAFYKLMETKGLPQVDIIQGGKFIYRESVGDLNLEKAQKIEQELQRILRLPDPGLSLPYVYEPENASSFFVRRVFSLNMSEVDKAKNIDLGIKGKWNFENGRISTQDKDAEISFKSLASRVVIVAEPYQERTGGSSLVMLINGLPVAESLIGPDAKFDEVQNAVVSFKEAGSFSILKDLDSRNREITLKFPLAGTKPIAIHGLRFFE